VVHDLPRRFRSCRRARFRKVMTKTNLPYINSAGDLRPARRPARSTHVDPLRLDLGFVKLSPGPKNGVERRRLRFSTICAKNQVLKFNIDKVTVILRHFTVGHCPAASKGASSWCSASRSSSSTRVFKAESVTYVKPCTNSGRRSNWPIGLLGSMNGMTLDGKNDDDNSPHFRTTRMRLHVSVLSSNKGYNTKTKNYDANAPFWRTPPVCIRP
jgi:hypothetical protein